MGTATIDQSACRIRHGERLLIESSRRAGGVLSLRSDEIIETNFVRFRLRGIPRAHFVDQDHRLEVTCCRPDRTQHELCFYLDITDPDTQGADHCKPAARRL